MLSRYRTAMFLARGTLVDEDSVRASVRLVDGRAPMEVTEWQALADGAIETNAFAEPWFVLPALRHLREDTRVCQMEARDGHTLVGLMHLTVQKGYGRMPVRYVGNWAHYQCFMGTPLIAAGHETAVWKAFLACLDQADWAPNFLSLAGLERDGPVHQALMRSGADLGREVAIVRTYDRALLSSTLAPDAYLEAAVRGKKRKELRRLANRLAEQGEVRFSCLSRDDDLDPWITAFLDLERAGWKGRDGAALGREEGTTAFFREMICGAHQTGRLDFQRLDLDGTAIAMLVNFVTPPGSWSFKIAFDEDYARYSPGVMIELENLRRVLEDPALRWMDSCAAENHPMIDRLWMERRSIAQVTVPLAGARRRLVHAVCRTAENSASRARSLLSRKSQPEPDHD